MSIIKWLFKGAEFGIICYTAVVTDTYSMTCLLWFQIYEESGSQRDQITCSRVGS